MRIFLSAASAEFHECRAAITSDLHTVTGDVVVQEELKLGPGTLVEHLQECVTSCDRAIVLIGDAYGYPAEGVSTPPGSAPRSYTQWEYFFAIGERLDGSSAPCKDVFIYLASEEFTRDVKIVQTDEKREWQQQFKAEIKKSGIRRAYFNNIDHLCRQVLRDLFSIDGRPVKPYLLPCDSLRESFVGREPLVAEIDRIFKQSRSGLASAVALTGMGGIGKTCLAIEYAIARREEVAAILFVRADTAAQLREAVGDLSEPQALNLKHASSEIEARLSAVSEWFQKHPRAILILDNIDTPELAAEVQLLVPRFPGSQILITTRITRWHRSVTTLPVTELPVPVSAQFLLDQTQGARRAQKSDERDARRLARLVEGLPLALTHAVAFINQRGISFEDYEARWKKSATVISNWFDDRVMNYSQSLATTWFTTLDQLSPVANALFHLLCWMLSGSGLVPGLQLTDYSCWYSVPIELGSLPEAEIEIRAAIGRLPSFARLPDSEQRAIDVEGALAELRGYSLITPNTANNRFRIPSMLVDMTRLRLPLEERAIWQEAAHRLMVALVISMFNSPQTTTRDAANSFATSMQLGATERELLLIAELLETGSRRLTHALVRGTGHLVKVTVSEHVLQAFCAVVARGLLAEASGNDLGRAVDAVQIASRFNWSNAELRDQLLDLIRQLEARIGAEDDDRIALEIARDRVQRAQANSS